MTREEFDTWIENHYGELIAVARRRGYRDARGTVHAAIAGMLASPSLAGVQLHRPEGQAVMAVWPWAVNFLRGTAQHAHRGASRDRARMAEAKNIALAGSFHGRKRTSPKPTEG